MAKMQDHIMAYLYSELKRKGKVSEPGFMYDITATYMDGTKYVIAKYDYASGGKRRHKQIKIALVVTKDGYPFYWKVFKGITSDNTAEKIVTEMRELFGIENCSFVIAEVNQDAASASKSRHLEPLRNKVTNMLSRLKLTQVFERAFDEICRQKAPTQACSPKTPSSNLL
ncbi:MAG: hypothetical protein ACOX8A_08480, partial [Thermacetogeniaceae bacterium]